MSDVVLHIGMQRTGTTFLQHEIFPRLPVRYVGPGFFDCGDIGSLAEHHGFICDGGMMLVSNENIWYHETRDGFQDTRMERLELIRRLFPGARIIFGARDQESLLWSLYRKKVACGATWTFDEFLEMVDPAVYEMDSYIDRLREIFPDVFCYRYCDFRDDTRGVVGRICDFIGVDAPDMDDSVFERRWNRGYSDVQLRVARFLNRFFRTELNQDGMFPLPYRWHPHKILFQNEIPLHLRELFERWKE